MLYKCKMCGGNLIEDSNNKGIAICENCGTKQTISTSNDEIISNLYNRANNLRLKCEFDKAANIYEKIIETKIDEAEAYFDLVLCKYGIEYVDDPKTNTKIPTCHRTLYESILADPDYEAAIDYANSYQEAYYKEQARLIDHLQKDILNIVKNEKPFDVFICYKETDENNQRTIDSVLANDIYYELSKEGFKVFYAAITLEDKLGQEYEPYIFAALNSAKAMLVVTTKPEYVNSVWVKNEWSRYLKLMKTDKSKTLIPCYKDMDPYDLPEEFAHLQAQDMSKIGFINDITRGIKKLINKDEDKVISNDNNINNTANIDTLLRRVQLFIEDGNTSSANAYLEKVLDINPECAEAYLYKLLIDLNIKKKEDLTDYLRPFGDNQNFQKVIRFGDESLVKELEEYRDNTLRNIDLNVETCANSYKKKIINNEKFKIAFYNEILENYGFEKCVSLEDIPRCIDAIDQKCEELQNKKQSLSVFAVKEANQLHKQVIDLNCSKYLYQLIEYEFKNIEKYKLPIDAKFFDNPAKFLLDNDFINKTYQEKYPNLYKEYKFSFKLSFGYYRQHNNNKKEPVIWNILRVEKDKGVLLISNYALDKKYFDTKIKYNVKDNTLSKPSDWSTSTLRKWLNNEFLKDTFDEAEQKMIIEPVIKDGGVPVLTSEDKAFLLSFDEVNRYLGSNNSDRQCKGTEYAAGEKVNVSWFLRSPGFDGDACIVHHDGHIFGNGKNQNYSIIRNVFYVRPCIWVKSCDGRFYNEIQI